MKTNSSDQDRTGQLYQTTTNTGVGEHQYRGFLNKIRAALRMSVMFDQWHGKSYKWARINQSNLLGAMSRRPKQLRRIRRQDYNGISDGKYKVSVISGETVNGEHVLQDKSGSYTPST